MTQSLALAAAGTAAAAGAATIPPASTTYRVVFQVSDADPAKWNLTLGNIRNAQAELGAGNVTVEIVAFGPGIAMLVASSEAAGRIDDAVKTGVAVLACQNSMRGQKLTEAQMHPRAGYVPSGVAHAIRRQTEGYSYIRS
jgi:intracellular sulfur oxidation DsrE/DsrF family protein